MPVSFSAEGMTLEELDAHFSGMTRSGFHEFLAGLMESGQPQNAHLLLGLARKLFEDANFSDGLPEAERISWSDFADNLLAQSMTGYPEAQRKSISDGWEATKDFAGRFGYKSGALYETLAPHRVFKVG